jgi:hypothetical protein
LTLPPHNLRAPTNPQDPQYTGVCDRCGFYYPLDRLVWQYDYRGNALANLRIRVCTDRCLDEPYEHFRPILVGPDPIPPTDPRPTSYATQNLGGQPPIFNPNSIYPDFDTAPVLWIGDNGAIFVTERGVTFKEG